MHGLPIFFSNPTEGGVANEVHPQVTKRNGIFAFEEMMGLEPVFSCSYACPTSAASSLIVGPDVICTTAGYSAIGFSSAKTVIWDNSLNLSYISGQNTNQYTVSKIGNGNGFIKVTLMGACGSIENQKDVWVDKPNSPGALTITSGSFSNMCINSQVQVIITSVPGAALYSWISNNPTGLGIEGSGTSALITGIQSSLNSPNGYWTFTYSADNTCGSSSKLYGVVINNCTVGGGGQLLMAEGTPNTTSLTFSPNPSSTTMMVELTEKERTDIFIEEIEVVNGNGTSQLRISTNARKVEIPVGSLPKGYNYLRVRINGETSVTRIIIE